MSIINLGVDDLDKEMSVLMASTKYEILKESHSNHSFSKFYKVSLMRNNRTETFKLNRIHGSGQPDKQLAIQAILYACFTPISESHLIQASPVKQFKDEQLRKVKNLYTDDEIDYMINYFN